MKEFTQGVVLSLFCGLLCKATPKTNTTLSTLPTLGAIKDDFENVSAGQSLWCTRDPIRGREEASTRSDPTEDRWRHP